MVIASAAIRAVIATTIGYVPPIPLTEGAAISRTPACPTRERELTGIVESCGVANQQCRLMSTRRTPCEKRFGR
jgi:hypothetical protein